LIAAEGPRAALAALANMMGMIWDHDTSEAGHTAGLMECGEDNPEKWNQLFWNLLLSHITIKAPAQEPRNKQRRSGFYVAEGPAI
jgi:hypothetical protein